jgi:hypothetical protein
VCSATLKGRDRRIGGTRRGIRVDEKLTERRDEASLDGIQRTQERGADLRISGFEPVTSDFG